MFSLMEPKDMFANQLNQAEELIDFLQRIFEKVYYIADNYSIQKDSLFIILPHVGENILQTKNDELVAKVASSKNIVPLNKYLRYDLDNHIFINNENIPVENTGYKVNKRKFMEILITKKAEYIDFARDICDIRLAVD